MVWQDVLSPAEPGIDAEQERETRLAAQARAGADWALAALIARYQPPVIRYLTRLIGNPSVARQISERIFVRMERRIHGPQGVHHLRLWLLRACTEAGLEALRHPRRATPSRLGAPSGPAALLAERAGPEPVRRFMAGLGRLAEATTVTRRQSRPLVWTDREDSGIHAQPSAFGTHATNPMSAGSDLDPLDEELDSLDPREALRHRLVRLVLAELPYGDAQCLALHLVAGLNQTEVAKALGITASAARKRIVIGLQMFAARYEAALSSLGVPPELGYHIATEDDQVAEEQFTEPVGPASQRQTIPPIVASRPVIDDEPIHAQPTFASAAESQAYGSFVGAGAREDAPYPAFTSQVDNGSALQPTAAQLGVNPIQTMTEPRTPQEQSDVDIVHVGALDDISDDAETLAEITAFGTQPTERRTVSPPIMRLADNAILGPVVDALPVAPDSSIPGRRLAGFDGEQQPLSYDLPSAQAVGEPTVVSRPLAGSPLAFELEASEFARTPAPQTGAPSSPLAVYPMPTIAAAPSGGGDSARDTSAPAPVGPGEAEVVVPFETSSAFVVARRVPVRTPAPIASHEESEVTPIVATAQQEARRVPVRTPAAATQAATSLSPDVAPLSEVHAIGLVTEITLDDVWTNATGDPEEGDIVV